MHAEDECIAHLLLLLLLTPAAIDGDSSENREFALTIADVASYAVLRSMTSASLISISRLTRLQELVLNGNMIHVSVSSFSVKAILTLLRGPSRHVLRLIMISCAPLALDAVAQEVQLMQEERRRMSGRSREALSLSRETGAAFHFSIRATGMQL